MKVTMRLLSALVICCFVIPEPAQAYLDPATGSMILQIAIGGLLATMAAVKIYWRKIRSIFSKEKDLEPK